MELQMKRLRKEHGGMTQQELANAIGTTLRKISSWETGETSLPLEDAARIADVFGCSLDELAGRRWPPDGAAYPVTPDEAALVEDFRRMDGADRPGFISTAHALAFAGEAKKEEHRVALGVDG